MPILNSVVLPEKLHRELISATKKRDTIEAIKVLLKRDLIRKQNKYMYIVQNFEKKYKMKFEDFENAYKEVKMGCEIEKDYFDWDMAVTVLDDIEEEFKEIE